MHTLTTLLFGFSIHALIALCLARPGSHPHIDVSIAKRDNPLTSLLSVLSGALGVGGNNSEMNSETLNPQGSGGPRANAALERALTHYAGYAEATYELTGKSWSCQICQKPEFQGTIVDVYWENAINGSTGYIAHNPNEKLIVVSFRGAKDLGDWVNSFNIELVPWPTSIAGSQVMAGVHEGYALLEPRIIPYVASLAERYPDYAILATGHSLGGARASLCALDLSTQYPQLVSRLRLYTYGIPKLGNSEFANAINRLEIPAYRAVNRGDLAPHLPIGLSDYVHFGTEAWIRDSGVTVCNGPTSGQCSDTLPPLSLSLIDHSSYPGMV